MGNQSDSWIEIGVRMDANHFMGDSSEKKRSNLKGY